MEKERTGKINQLVKTYIETLVEFSLQLHKEIIEKSGGLHAVRDQGGLYNSLLKITEREISQKYTAIQICAYTYKELATRHHFMDGNKRFSHIFAKSILLTKGHHLSVKYKNAEKFIIAIADKKMSLTGVQKWIRENSIKIMPEKYARYMKALSREIAKKE